ncbi:hypothetical protein [Streptomyces reniochalinae]|uniref:PH domain-containing protein n=1 Tax=Streptomyces reniochalinae TaxID=2250578 RepID=A0A367EJX7_9ACTN|nr:hypothetical protein [Streptomyces reniochalinae]RCG18351.1 hypothetical protein DQ392_13445 [Streptomyces reniochalinae]
MPLPFVTADREDRVQAAQSVTLAEADRDLWRRPYRPGPWRVGGGALLLLLASYVLFSALVIALAGSLPSAAVCAGCGVLVIVLAVRLLRAGVWVSSHGLRQAGLLRTTTLRWAEVGVVRTVQRPVRWLGMPRTVQGQALVLYPRTRAGNGAAGSDAEERRILLTDHNADFLPRRPGFERAADVIESWAAESRS